MNVSARLHCCLEKLMLSLQQPDAICTGRPKCGCSTQLHSQACQMLAMYAMVISNRCYSSPFSSLLDAGDVHTGHYQSRFTALHLPDAADVCTGHNQPLIIAINDLLENLPQLHGAGWGRGECRHITECMSLHLAAKELTLTRACCRTEQRRMQAQTRNGRRCI